MQGLESLVSSTQQQPKEAEVHSAAEIQGLQGRLQTVCDATVQPRYLCMCCLSFVSRSREVILRLKCNLIRDIRRNKQEIILCLLDARNKCDPKTFTIGILLTFHKDVVLEDEIRQRV